jgi:putative lipoprotein (rSAM/lipoprotein system)
MKLSGKIIAKLLMLCGISLTCTACYAPGPAMFEIKGRVTDEGNPIEGIQVMLKSSPNPNEIFDQTTTDETGCYYMNSFNYIDDRAVVEVKDIDGEANGGDFATQIKNIVKEHKQEGGNIVLDFELGQK